MNDTQRPDVDRIEQADEHLHANDVVSMADLDALCAWIRRLEAELELARTARPEPTYEAANAAFQRMFDGKMRRPAGREAK